MRDCESRIYRKKERFVKKPQQGMTETSRSTVCYHLLQLEQVTHEPQISHISRFNEKREPGQIPDSL